MITQATQTVRLGRVRRGVREPVEIEEKRFGYFPQRFRWRGTVYGVDRVERCWTIMRPIPRLCFRVSCGEKVFELYQNVRANVWEVAQV